jgi:hypothetical protein
MSDSVFANVVQHFQVEISEWKENYLAPFVPEKGDNIQLEFSMLSPFHRLNLSPISQTANSTIFGVAFKTPDHRREEASHSQALRSR